MNLIRKHQTGMLSPTGDEGLKKQVTEIFRMTTAGDQKLLKVSIFSPDRFIRDFLQGILAYQGYKCIGAAELQDNILDLPFPGDQVVFLDGAYWSAGHDPEHLRNWVNLCAQAGIPLVVLANRKGESDFRAIQKINGCQVLWKPLDYRQVGQVMAQLGFEPGEI